VYLVRDLIYMHPRTHQTQLIMDNEDGKLNHE